MKCEICNKETRNKRVCSRRCASKLSGISRAFGNNSLLRVPKQGRNGYWYYTWNMLDEDERAFVPGHGSMILVHRWVMSQALGRPLSPTEVVRHIDGNPSNNDPSNLMVGSLSDNTGDHVALIKSMSRRRQVMLDILGILHG